jgi:hypothetical protein
VYSNTVALPAERLLCVRSSRIDLRSPVGRRQISILSNVRSGSFSSRTYRVQTFHTKAVITS